MAALSNTEMDIQCPLRHVDITILLVVIQSACPSIHHTVREDLMPQLRRNIM